MNAIGSKGIFAKRFLRADQPAAPIDWTSSVKVGRLTSSSVGFSFAILHLVFFQHFLLTLCSNPLPEFINLFLTDAPLLCVFNQLVAYILIHLFRRPSCNLSFFYLALSL